MRKNVKRSKLERTILWSVLALVSYVFSFGPVGRILTELQRRNLLTTGEIESFSVAYWPIGWGTRSSEWFSGLMLWWFQLWQRP